MRKHVILLFVYLLFFHNIQAQILPPYTQQFDSLACTGWTHYALTGTDDWQRGIPSGGFLNTPFSPAKVWGTNLSGVTTANSIMALETPDFDLSDTSKTFLLSIAHEYQTYSYHGGNIQYSIDLGINWIILNGIAAEKQNWYNNISCSGLSGQPTWSNNYYASYQFSSHSLAFLQGQENVRFRFQYGGSNNPQDGWQIDNFLILENIPNISAIPGVTYNASKHFTSFDIVSPLLYNGILPPVITNVTNYYFSRDSILDAGDSLLGNKTQSISTTVTAWSKTFPMVPNLIAGDYYIFYTHDYTNNLVEPNETDNTSFCVLHIDSTFTIPEYKEGFEDSLNYWINYSLPTATLFWMKGSSNVHQSEGTHSGINSWFITNYWDDLFYTYGPQYLESPYLDFSPTANNVLCFWYKMKREATSGLFTAEYSSVTSTPAFTTPSPINETRINGWDCHCQSLFFLNGKKSAKIRFKYGLWTSTGSTTGMLDGKMNIDDIYIGQPRPDLSIENTSMFYSTPLSFISDTITYTLFNSGLNVAGSSVSEFYWSADSLLDGSDLLVATVNELPIGDTLFRQEKVIYTKPTLSAGNYFLIYKLDVGNLLNEMREENNIGYFKIKQISLLPLPYFNDFETQIDGWSHNSTIGNDDWKWGVPSGTLLNSAFSGTQAFHTTDSGILSAMSRQHLYTPVFDFSLIPNPVLEFDMKLHGDGSCTCFNSKMNMSYSVDGGATWIVLDTVNQSYNKWYYPMIYEDMGGRDKPYYVPNYTELLFNVSENTFANFQQYNSRDVERNTHYVTDLSFLSGYKNVQFRYNIGTRENFFLPSASRFEGAIIDNFKIENKYIDLVVNYKKALMISSLNQKIKFTMNLKNQGNYIAEATSLKFYVSADTTFDGSDYYIGQTYTNDIRPDMLFFLSQIFNAPPALSSYSYLIYQIDPLNDNAESDEINNIGYWPLALDSISTYPYVQDFSDTILNGWTGYMNDYVGGLIKNKWRFRNILAPFEPYMSTSSFPSKAFTERVDPTMTAASVPYMYLETPSFDFSNHDSLSMAFDLFCLGISVQDGGNVSFSTDGGTTWTILTTAYGSAVNWYNETNMLSMSNEPGWSNFVTPQPVRFNISFLRGEKHVVFRFKHKSKGVYGVTYTNPQGLQLANFVIDGFSNDHIANDVFVPVSVTTSPSVNINYSITNAGMTDGRLTKTKFYWSTDNIFTSSDSLIKTKTELPISSGSTLNTSTAITFPAIAASTYYLFYLADADSNLVETNENNNVGSFVLDYSAIISVPEITQGSIIAYVNEETLMINSPTNVDGMYTISFINSTGQKISSGEIYLKQGINKYPLPDNISSGLYFVTLQNTKGRSLLKITIIK